MNYEIITYRPEFKNQIVELQTQLWSPDISLNTAYLEWKYEDNPYVDRPHIYVALCAGNVVGMRGMYGAKWQIGHPPQMLPVLGAGDLVIAPAHRDRGLFTKIMQTAFNDLANMGYTYVFNCSANHVTRLGSLAMGWRSAGSLERMIRKTEQTTRVFTEDVPPFYFLDREDLQRRRDVNPYVVVEQTPRAEAMADLVDRVSGDGRIRHVRDRQYFAWRFQNPLSRYRFLFWEDARLEGYLVLHASMKKHSARLSMVDWEATHTQVRADLLKAAVHLSNAYTLTIWSATLSDEAKTLLHLTGFHARDETGGITSSHPIALVTLI
jgi:GNAT superfamily N-acetyltransferase